MGRISTQPSYKNALGQDIYTIDGATYGTRQQADVLLLVIHHTGGADSRQWLTSPQTASATYLVGAYPDTNNLPRVYKYMSEIVGAPNTQGYGSLGGLPGNPNKHAISIEVEGGLVRDGVPHFRTDVLDASARLAGAILRYWHDEQGRNLLLTTHDHLDSFRRGDRHSDPWFDWLPFCVAAYAYAQSVSASSMQAKREVRGWGRNMT